MAILTMNHQKTWEDYRPKIDWTGIVNTKEIKTTMISATWESNDEVFKAKAEALYKDKILTNLWHNGTLFTLNRFDLESSSPEIVVGKCSYLDYRTTLLDLESPITTNAIVITCIIVTLDGYMIIGDRTSETSVNGRIEQLGLIGGTYNEDELSGDYSLDSLIRLEINEELGVDLEIDCENHLIALGHDSLYKDKRTILFFEVKLPLTLEQVQGSFKNKGNKSEHKNILGIRNKRKYIDRLAITREPRQFTEALKAGLFLYPVEI